MKNTREIRHMILLRESHERGVGVDAACRFHFINDRQSLRWIIESAHTWTYASWLISIIYAGEYKRVALDDGHVI